MKEFEALERLKTAPDFMGGTMEYRFNTNSQVPLLEDYELIKQTLLELQAIKEAKPSETIKCLEELERDIKGRVILAEDRQLKLCATIKQALLKAQELEKVLEVIFEKPLSLLVLKLFERSGISDLEYEFFVEGYKAVIEEINEDVKEQIATEEEFDLLKRHLNGK